MGYIQFGQENQYRERKQRRDKGRILLTERDEVVLCWIGEQYAIRLDQLQRLLGRYPGRATKVTGIVGITTAQSILARWLKAGLVEVQKFRVKEPSWLWLTRAGLRHVGLEFYYKTPHVATLEHTYWVNQVRLTSEPRWQAMDGSRRWISERRLRRDTSQAKGRSAARAHFPDAVVGTAQGKVALEIELTPKKPNDLKAIMASLADEYAGVWYFYNRRTQSGVERCVAQLSERARACVRLIDLSDL